MIFTPGVSGGVEGVIYVIVGLGRVPGVIIAVVRLLVTVIVVVSLIPVNDLPKLSKPKARINPIIKAII